MSYRRAAKDRQRALLARYGKVSDEVTPRTYHRDTPIHSRVEADKKLRDSRGYRKHKGDWT
jgi:hypothetical protein